MEARGFRDAYPSFQKRGVVILGISPDKPQSQKKFKEKEKLPFTLLCDTETKVAAAYGAWKEKTTFGIKALGIVRSTFLISPEGIVRKVFPKVKPDGHAQEVLAELDSPRPAAQ